MQRSFPTLRAAARWLLLAAVSAAGFALGVAASRPAPLSQAAVIPTPRTRPGWPA